MADTHADPLTFTATVELGGKTATGIEVPGDVVEALDAGRRPPVVVTLGRYAYRSTIASRGGRFLVPLSAEHREGAGLAAGDQVEVTLAVDTSPRSVDVPDDLARALEEAGLRGVWDELSHTDRRRHAESVVKAVAPQTRVNRVAKVVAILGV